MPPMTGALVAMLGIILLFMTLIAVSTVLPFVFTLWIITASIPRIKSSLDQRAKGSPFWIFMFSFGNAEPNPGENT
jgi:uncharacterized membrane protein HdeD (DUF308 family)